MTVGILFAPKSGDRTRRYLADRASNGTEYLADQAEQFKKQASDLVADQRDKLATAAKRVQSVYQS